MKKTFRAMAAAFVTAAVATVTVAVPVASADDATWEAPTSAVGTTTQIDGTTYRYVPAACVGGSVIGSEWLGISNVVDTPTSGVTTSTYNKSPYLGIYGSSANVNPDPYISNLFYNWSVDAKGGDAASKSDDALLYYTSRPSSMRQGTLAADTTNTDKYGTCTTLYKRPDMLIVHPASTSSFADQISEINSWTTASPYYKAKSSTYVGDNNYNPLIATYNANSIYTLVDSLYSMAQAAKDAEESAADEGVKLTTRYGDPTSIAMQAEQIVRGTQYYVLSKIADGTVSKRTVAYVYDATDANNIKLVANVDPEVCFYGTTHIMEGMVPTVNNLANVLDSSLEVNDDIQYVTCTIDDLAKADSIIIAPPDNSSGGIFAGTGAKTKLAESIQSMFNEKGYTEKAEQPIFCCNPTATSGLGQMSIDSLQMTAYANAFVYSDILNPVKMLAYYYQTLYHVKEGSLATALSMNVKDTMTLPKGVSLSDLSSYSSSEIVSLLESGVDYYYKNKDTINAQYPYLQISDYYNPETIHTVGMSECDIKTSFTSTSFTGKAIEPAVTVSYKGTELAAGTDYTVSYSNNKNAGTATVTVTGIGTRTGSATVNFTINKASQSLKVTPAKKTLKAKNLKKKAAKFNVKIAGNKTAVTVKSSSKKVTAAKNGKVVVKKGTKKGTYKITVKAAASGNYKAASKVVTIKVK